METLFDLKKKLYQLYKDALEEYPIDENDNDDLNYLERESYIIQEIQTLPNDKFEDFISLLAIWHYTYLKSWYEDEEFDEFYDEENEETYDAAIDSITNDSYNDFIYKTRSEVNEILEVMLDTFFESESLDSIENEDDIDDIDAFKEWYLIEMYEENNDVKEVFEKFHPNLNSELRAYNLYQNKQKYIDRAFTLTVNSTIEFIELFSITKRILQEKDFTNYFLYLFLHQMKTNNEKVFQDIAIFIFKYVYVKEYINQNIDLEETKLDILDHISDINNIESYEYFLDDFYDFEIITYSKMLANIPKNIEDDLKLISIDNNKTYGEKGIWKSFNLKKELGLIKSKIYINCPSWIYNIENPYKNHNYNCNIYFSINTKNEYTIPRLCIITNENNEIIDILGKENNLNIEYNMLEILEEKVKDINNNQKILSRIRDLKYLSNIDNKIKNEKDLENEEINFLYEITNKLDYSFFGHHDYRLRDLKENPLKKKYLSNYFNCKEEEIATNDNELNENTVILTKSLVIQTKTCNYPKLEVIFGNLYCSLLKDASGLKSLRIVKGTVLFESLTSSKGLESLIFIEKSARFESMKDKSHLNPNLYVGGATTIPGEKNPQKLK